jgi:hypothetical protein
MVARREPRPRHRAERYRPAGASLGVRADAVAPGPTWTVPGVADQHMPPGDLAAGPLSEAALTPPARHLCVALNPR